MFRIVIITNVFLCIFSSSVMATNLGSGIFIPQVTIDGNTSDAIKIQAKESLFLTVYSVEEQRFQPLSIPFDVVSLSGSDLPYRLTLPTSIHECEISGEVGVEVKLNNAEWSQEGSEFNGAFDSHVMNLVYESVPQQEDISQSCFGTLKVQVEVVGL
ncbi:hypothetical protein [Vibrio sp. OPT18]|uniref:hypothetical protein n=1 Tax=Vibrio sp. OPT18 TaxID=2778641 RepID=UPI00188179C8|nr:hypothetical protein [Vibrio sp. OPT18]MBE8574173.1 hypothetical protein [Vibrio sp. OPT18]